MGKNSEIEAQNTPLQLSICLEQETSEMISHPNEKLARIREDIFCAEPFQYYISEKSEPAAPPSMIMRFSLLIWLALSLFLLGLAILDILLDSSAGIPVFG
jgi:hypothetical protein